MSNLEDVDRVSRPELSTGQLVAVAAAACGGAAWLFQKLTDRSEPEDEIVPSDAVDLRGRLHQLADSETVRTVERRGNELAPVVQAYRERAGQIVGVASAEGAKRLSDAEKRLAERRKQSAKAVQRAEKQLAARRKQSAKAVRRAEKDLGKRVDRTRRRIDAAPVALAGIVDTGRQEIRHLERSAGARADSLRRTTSGLTGEVTTMANERVKRLQERGQEAAGAISATLRDSNQDTAGRVASARDQVVALAKSSSGDVTALLHDVREDARKNLPDVAKTVSGRAAEIGHQVAGSASRAGQVVSERAAGASDRVPGGTDAVGRAQAALSDATQKAAAVAGPAIGKVGERIGHLSDDLRDDPAGLRDRVIGQGQGALKTIQGQAAQTARDLVPTVKSSGPVQDRAAEARDRGLDLAALLQSNVPSFLAQVTDIIEQTGGKTGTRVSDVRKQGAKAVGEAEDGLQSALDRLGEAAKRAAQVGDQAVAASSHFRGSTRNAAHRTADAGKDGFESVIWLGAAGVAMYYGVLSPEQRATVNRVGLKVGRGLGKVIGEIRGQDQKF